MINPQINAPKGPAEKIANEYIDKILPLWDSFANVCVIVLLIEITTPAPLPQAKTKKQNNQNGISNTKNIKTGQEGKTKYYGRKTKSTPVEFGSIRMKKKMIP